jgi:SAM-dependent methyltransferase
MTQNIYDDPAFFAAYSGLRRSKTGLDGAPEWLSIQRMLPPLHDKAVIDLGCGYGWFCRWARSQGASSVLGLDVSERMLAQAGSMTADATIVYQRADLSTLSLPDAHFDLAYSSLALHYLPNLTPLWARLHRALRPNGSLVFSVEHPIFTAPSRAQWAKGADGRTTWPLDAYLQEGPRTTNWLADGVVKHHRTIGTYLNGLIAAGFVIDHVEEWRPTDAQIAAEPELRQELERPMFLLVGARRR